MSSLQPSSSVSSGLSGRQRFTRDYLAKQLPVFQEKVPRAAQETMKYPTDAPPNLPLPPVLPGEEILMKQHRVACLDTFSEPAVGSLYVTNFRLIFNGNSISDPESKEAIQEGLPARKEHTFSMDSGRGKLPRILTTRGGASATFNSYLTNPEQTPPGPSKWRLNSFRRSNRSATENPSPSSPSPTGVKKSSSLRRSPKTQDTTDGGGGGGGTHAGGVWSEIGSVLNRGARSLRMTTAKRRGIVNHSDTAQWGSLSSVSSVSELSEAPTTGTDETSERELDSNVSPVPPPLDLPMFAIGSSSSLDRGAAVASSYDVMMSDGGSVLKSGVREVPVMTVQRGTPTNSLDSGVITDPLSGSWNTAPVPNGGMTCGTGIGNEEEEEIDFERYSAETLDPILETEAQRLELESSVDPSLLLNPVLERERQEYTRRSWFHKSASPSPSPSVVAAAAAPVASSAGSKEGAESMSEEEYERGSADEEEISRTLTQESPEPLHSCSRGDDGDTAAIGYSKIEIMSQPTVEKTSKKKKLEADRSSSPVYSVPVRVSGRGEGKRSAREAGKTSGEKKEKKQAGLVDAGGRRLSPSPCRKPLPPTPPKKPGGGLTNSLSSTSTLSSSVGGSAERVGGKCADSDERENSREESVGRKNGCGGRGEGEHGAAYMNFSVMSRRNGRGASIEATRDRSVSTPDSSKKPKPLPRKADTLGRIETDRGFGASLPASFKPPLPPKPPLTSLTTSSSPSSSPSLSPKVGVRSSQKRPPISPKPASSHHRLPSPPTTRAKLNHSSPTASSEVTPSGPAPTVTLSAHVPSSPSHGSSLRKEEEEEEEVPVEEKKASPVAPPRRKRKGKTTPTHSSKGPPLSPIYSPAHSSTVSPAHSSSPVALSSSDTAGGGGGGGGSSDPQDTSSESDLSSQQPRHNTSGGDGRGATKFLPSPSPSPRSPSPFRDSASPLGWHDDGEQSQNSSVVAQRHSVPSVLASLPPPSPFDPSSDSTYSYYMGDREPLASSGAVTTPYSTITRNPQSMCSLPTSTRYSFSCSLALFSIHSIKKQPALFLREESVRLPEGIVVQSRNFRSLKLHIHPQNRYDADGLKELLEKKVLVEKPPQELFAFHYCSAIRHPNPNFLHTTSLPNFFKLQDEMERLKVTSSPVWHVSSVLRDNPEVSPSYPHEVIVPLCIPDVDLLRGAKLYRGGRFPSLTWCDLQSNIFLLRAAPTLTHRGQSNTVEMRLDEAILQAVCVFTEKAQGNTKLYIFTEKPDSSTSATLSDPMHTSLTAAQKRAYYYQNCQFHYSVSPPNFKSLRHSFRKLSALLEENKVGEDEFLIALDDTQWLYRVQELLQTAAAVVSKMEEEHASVLVSYDSGWDRTTQVTGLAQLLMDPYYRTMDGFQVLVQKEWLWFGHPFESRHTRHGRAKEDGPVFLQWVDCVWQVMQQCPSAFEFNEKFLMVLVESSYSGQFGTFLLNNEQERHKNFADEAHKHKSVATHTLSLWTWVAMVNAAGNTFYNNLYDAHTFPWVIYPNCTVPCLRLWTKHYSQSRYEDHHSTNTTPLQKQLDLLLREYQLLSRKIDVSGPTPNRAPSSTSLPPSSSDETTRSAPNFERERERVRLSGRTTHNKTPVHSHYQTIQQYLSTQGIDSGVCKHALIVGNTTCQGYLIKLGGVRKNWQSRWFVLDFASHLLTYFESKEAYTTADRGTPKGVVELNEMTKVWQNTKKKEHLVRHVFTVDTRNRTYLFRAPSLLTMQLWMAVLNMPRSALQIDL